MNIFVKFTIGSLISIYHLRIEFDKFLVVGKTELDVSRLGKIEPDEML